MDVTGVPGSAHGDIPELPASAVGEEVGGIHGGALTAVHGGGVPVGEAVRCEVVGTEAVLPAVVHARQEAPGVHVDDGDDAALGGDGAAVGPWSEGDDPVPRPVPGAVDDQFCSGQASRVGHDRPGPGVEGGDVRSPPRQYCGVPPGLDVGAPGGHGGVEGRVAGECGDDLSLLGVPVDGDLDAPGSQLSERYPFVGVDLADVLSQDVDPVALASHQRFQAATGADRAELAVIADDHRFRPGGLRRGQQAQHRRVWTNDKDLLGTGIPTWTTQTLQAWLDRNPSSDE
jgi:hypothetical protein